MDIETTGPRTFTLADHELLEDGEAIAVVDDHADITELLTRVFREGGFSAFSAPCAADLRKLLNSHPIALIILDINLPDANGISLLDEIKALNPDAAIIMLTAASKLETALDCLRRGADDYLTKPVRLAELLAIVRRVLEKRRLSLRSRRYREQLESAWIHIERIHSLSIKMNEAYLSITSQDRLMRAILTGITAHEGLGFNRAFLLLLGKDGKQLNGRCAIGPVDQKEGVAIWRGIAERHLTLDVLLRRLEENPPADVAITGLAQAITLDTAESDHIVLRALNERRTLVVRNGEAEYPVPPDLIRRLGVDSFVIAPLFVPERALGVVIADHFVSRRPFEQEQLRGLESFLGQAGLAFEHGTLHQALQDKVAELEELTRELHRNQELLVTTRRYTAVGQMAAQLAHSIKNPITAIGGTARLLARKTEDDGRLRTFLDSMVDEVKKVEKLLDGLARFAEAVQPAYETASLVELARNAALLYRQDMERRGIDIRCDFPPNLPDIELDPKLIRQSVAHLIANAVDAMPEGGELTLTIALEDDGLALTVRDTGAGISAAIVRNVSDPFFTTKIAGTGLGLSVTRRIIEDHGGSLTLGNDAGGGTRAKIWLPLHRRRTD